MTTVCNSCINSLAPINYGKLFTIYPVASKDPSVVVVTNQDDVKVYQGYAGDHANVPFSDKIETARLIVKCETDKNQTKLYSIIVLSKQPSLPFQVMIARMRPNL